MKYLFTTLGLVAIAAAVTGLVCYRISANPALHAAAEKHDAMEWLRTDFHLTDGQFAEIRRLHESYAGACDEHCRMIREATKMRDQIVAAGQADPAAVGAANQRLQDLRTLCETAIARHVRQVAALMAPEDGRRYLALVLPKIADFDHMAAPDLRLSHPT